jgi:aspartate/methionine/tyrosine aminotransferase
VGDSISSKRYDLGWGNAVAVRSAFLDGLALKTVFFSLNDTNLSYTAHSGDLRLIEITRKVIERQVGPTYRHIFLVNGATGGVTIALRAYAQKGHRDCVTKNPPYFPIYPAMIESAGLRHTLMCEPRDWNKPVILLDSPSNPQGHVEEGFNSNGIPIIHDAVYHSKVYTYGNFKAPPCDVLVGSYSKLLGFNGIRTGWIATNDDLLAVHLKSLVEAEYCGLSSASTHVLLTVLKGCHHPHYWENFERRARNNLDDNRAEWSSLEKYFGDQRVYGVGMFYYAPIDKACRKLLEKSGIKWTPGSQLGATDDFGRFNLAQDKKLVRQAVREVIKYDKS